MGDINNYLIMNRKTSPIIKVYIIISLVFIFTALLISQLNYKKYYKSIGQVLKEENIYYLSLYLYPHKLNIIKKNNKLIIDDYEYNYSIEKIENEYFIANDYNSYLKVDLNINLKEEDKIVNNVLEVKILESNQKIFYYIKNYLKKGRKKWK